MSSWTGSESWHEFSRGGSAWHYSGPAWRGRGPEVEGQDLAYILGIPWGGGDPATGLSSVKWEHESVAGLPNGPTPKPLYVQTSQYSSK